MVFMDPKSLEKDLFIDLESGKHAVLKESLSEDSCSSDSGFPKDEEHTSVQYCSLSLSEGSLKNVEDIGKRSVGGAEKMVSLEKVGAEKPRKKKCKKPPRPPRPHKLSLDSTEQKLAKEISELAMLKRARIERMKALKNMKNAKQASSNNSLCALVITVLFCLVVVWQGVFSRDAAILTFHGSPESSHEASGNLISVQFYKNVSASPSVVEQTYGVDVHKGAESDGRLE